MLAEAKPVPPCRITNTSDEVRFADIWGEEKDYIEKDQIQIPNPELGPLERRVTLPFEEAFFEDADDINIEDTQYWFTEPPGDYGCCSSCLNPTAYASSTVYLRDLPICATTQLL